MNTNTTMTNFEKTLRAYEHDPMNGECLQALARAVASSVVKKVKDPQAKAAQNRETVSNSGCSPTIAALRAGLYADIHHLDAMSGEEADSLPTDYTISDGYDLVQEAALAIWEYTTTRATDWSKDGWMEDCYTIRAVKRHVLTIHDRERVDWEDRETTPIQEAYKATRRAIDKSRAVRVDPKCKTVYVEDLAHDSETDALETIYIRAGRYADIGGYETDFNGKETVYTGDLQTIQDRETILAELDLNPRQKAVLEMREQGLGYAAIAKRLNIPEGNVCRTFRQIQARAVKVIDGAEKYMEA